MSITIEQQPQRYTPAYNDMRYVVSSTNTAQDNFKYICDMYVNGTKVGRIERSPDPDFGVATFDVKRFIHPYITHDIDLTSTAGTETMENSYVVLLCKFGEQYGPSSGITTYADLTLSSSIYPWSASIGSLTFIDFNYMDYMADSTFIGSFLTNKPRPHRIYQDQNDWLAMYTRDDNELRVIGVVTYDSDGNVIQSAGWLNAYNTPTTVDNHRFIRFPSGYNMNDVASLSTGSQPILDDSVAYYTIYALDGGLARVSEIMTVNIECDLGATQRYTVYFLNALGAFDTFRFTQYTSKGIAVERKEYKQDVGTLSASAFTVAKTDRGYNSYFTKYGDTWTLRSDVLTDEETVWLEELVTSPEVYIEINGELIAVNVTTNNYDKVLRADTNELKRLEIQVKFSQDNYRQIY